ncbi:MAG: NAD(P)-dependent oxidoreductase [Tunicatimonas sp.]|uniref:NAD(P)-dependent oxidoreductase n=1 Tax=Tunicatimonas sp. TaxID=1940096 RepID=UPI003C763567
MHVAFIGLGIMGSRMASNLLKNDVELSVYNRSPESVQALVSQGATGANSSTEAVADADVVITMLSSPKVVSQVMLENDGGLTAMKKDALWIDCSTVNPSFSVRAGQMADARGVRFMDAPVAGSKPQAEHAELVFFVGGEISDLSEVESLLQLMSKKVIHVGEVGKGASFKMLVNAMLAQSMILFSETLLLGEKMGLSQDFLLNTMPGLPVVAPFVQAKTDMIRSGNYEVQFPLELMHKDLHLAALTAYEHQQPLYLANLAKELYAHASQSGLGRADFAAIHQFLGEKK